MTLWQLTTGANVSPECGVQFRVWAPHAKTLDIKLGVENPTLHPMRASSDGYFELELPQAKAGTDYLYVIDGTRERPDPVSRSQPYGVHRHSRIVDPRDYTWKDLDWKGIELNRLILYELHVGTFTPEGTFDSAIPKLPYLRDLGVTAIELMPITTFPGTRNWGYDSTHPYAPHPLYGGPSALKRLIDACHQHQLAVILDVVYNHLGPEGNYLSEFGPYFTDRYKTPWGQAINYDGPSSDAVRSYFTDNALYWLTEYHVDGLRLDAVHAIFDLGACHILYQIQNTFQQQADQLGRQAFIIAESDLNDIRVIAKPDENGFGINAQWNDDFHHSIHALLTQDQQGYFQDFGRLDDLVKAITQGFVYDWKYSHYRQKHFGSSSLVYPGQQFVICLQNHDQIAQACHGKRISNILSLEAQKLAACLLFLAPNLPLLFMGQEWGASTPFSFFTEFEDVGLANTVRTAYQKQTGQLFDCQSPLPFENSKLLWEEQDQHPHDHMLSFYRTLLTLRKKYSCLSNCRKDLTTIEWDEHSQWINLLRSDAEDPAQIMLIANCSKETQTVHIKFPIGLWSVVCDSASTSFGGSREIKNPDQLGSISNSTLESIELNGYHAMIFCVRSPSKTRGTEH